MRIDSHQHFWRYSAAEYEWIDDSMSVLRRDFLPSDARREMDLAGIDACVAVQARQTLEETRWLLELADSATFIAAVVGWVDLQADDAEAQLARFAAHSKLVGVRHIVQSEPDPRFLLRPAFCRGISLVEELHLTYDILIYPRQLPAAIELVSRFPRQRFVLDHLAKPEIRTGEIREWERHIRELAEARNVWCKVSGLVTEADWTRWTAADVRPYLDVAFDCFGADRLLAGSDWPVCTVAANYGRTMSLLTDYLEHRPSSERDAVLGGNAARFWGLPAGELV
ncbi:MAG TPA: amidohydrolase family protein [Vicinamibacterales bacterium]|nr:amidohydrolase family protein [Vicinamibacterales bacterium]